MNILFSVIAVLAAIWLIGILVTRYLMKQAQDAMAKQYEMSEKKYTWENLGIPDELVKEFEEWHRYCKENGIDPRPMSPEKEKELIDKTVESLVEYWKRLTPLAQLKKGDVIEAYWFGRGRKMRWWEGDMASKAIRGTWFEFLIPKMSRNNMVGVYTREDFDWGNAIDYTRCEALFVVEERAPPENWKRKSQPTTDDLVRIIARRLNEDGTYNPNGELLAIGEDLWGKNPTKVALVQDRTFKKIFDLEKDDVFKADSRFVQGARWDGDETVHLNLETREDYKGNGCDPGRAGAFFVVESKDIREDDHYTYFITVWVEITARRLNDDGTYNPSGELIRFSRGDENWGEQVELVGQMNFGRTAMTYTLRR